MLFATAKSYLTSSRPRLRGIFTYYLLPFKKSVHAELVKSEEWKSKKSAHLRVRIFLAGAQRLELWTCSFGDCRSTNWTTPLLFLTYALYHTIFKNAIPFLIFVVFLSVFCFFLNRYYWYVYTEKIFYLMLLYLFKISPKYAWNP